MPVSEPLYVGSFYTEMEAVYNDWTRLIDELRRIKGRLATIETLVTTVASQALGQIQTYEVDPVVEGLTPPNQNAAAICYPKAGSGAVLLWDKVNHVWFV